MFFLVPAYPGCPGPKAVKRLCVCVCVCVWYRLTQVVLEKTLLDGCSSSKVIISVIPEEKKKKNGAGI